MNRADLLPYANEKLVAIVLLVLSFLPIEPSCVPSNFFLFVAPVAYLVIRFAVNRKIKRTDIFITLGFLALIIFISLLALAIDCSTGYRLDDIVQPEWQRVNIDAIGPDGKLYIKNVMSMQVAVTDILFHLNYTQVSCTWEPGARFIAPAETKYCQLPVAGCGNRTLLVEVFAPGNNDSVMC